MNTSQSPFAFQPRAAKSPLEKSASTTVCARQIDWDEARHRQECRHSCDRCRSHDELRTHCPLILAATQDDIINRRSWPSYAKRHLATIAERPQDDNEGNSVDLSSRFGASSVETRFDRPRPFTDDIPQASGIPKRRSQRPSFPRRIANADH